MMDAAAVVEANGKENNSETTNGKVNPQLEKPSESGADAKQEDAAGSSKITFDSDKPPEEGTFWKPIDDLLDSASKDMQLGQLIQMSGYGLYDAMSAIELMDPKMDSGIDAEGVHTFEEARALGLIPAELTPAQLIAIMDRLLCCEATWYTGYSLAQTVLLCLYMHNPKGVNNRWLRSYAISVMKTCDLIRTLVHNAEVYEEGDFTPSTFGFNLCSDVDQQTFLTDLKNAEAELGAKLKRARSTKSNANVKPAPGAEDQSKAPQPLQSDPSKEAEFCEALLARLRFRRAFYMVQLNMEQGGCEGLPAARKVIEHALAQLVLIRKSSRLGQGQLPANVFDTRVCRRMPTPVPPRTIDILEFDASLKFFEKILSGLQRLCGVLEETKRPEKTSTAIALHALPSGNDELSVVQDFVYSVTNSDPDIITRSRLRILFYHDKKLLGRRDITDAVREAMKEFPLPPGLADHSLAKPLIDKLAKVLVQQARMLSYNRARQRRKLVRSLEDWAVLENEAESLDQLFEQREKARGSEGGYFSWFLPWIVAQTFPLMRHYIQLGFELNLYHPCEYSMVFWYLDYLLGLQVRAHMEVRDAMKQMSGIGQSAEFRKMQERRNRKKGGKGAKPSLAGGAGDNATASAALLKGLDLTPRQYIAYGQHRLSGGLFRYIVAASVHQGYPLSKDGTTLGSMENRFYSRFSGFHRVPQPQPLHPAHYLSITADYVTKHGEAPEQIYNSAIESLKEAKVTFETVLGLPNSPLPEFTRADAKAMINVVSGNLTQLEAIVKNLEKAKRKRENQQKVLHYDFSLHRFYPVISLKPNPKPPTNTNPPPLSTIATPPAGPAVSTSGSESSTSTSASTSTSSSAASSGNGKAGGSGGSGAAGTGGGKGAKRKGKKKGGGGGGSGGGGGGGGSGKGTGS